MSEEAKERPAPKWYGSFPPEPGWYWAYQEIPKQKGSHIMPIWVDRTMKLPGYIRAWFGPLEPPAVPDEYKGQG